MSRFDLTVTGSTVVTVSSSSSHELLPLFLDHDVVTFRPPINRYRIKLNQSITSHIWDVCWGTKVNLLP